MITEQDIIDAPIGTIWFHTQRGKEGEDLFFIRTNDLKLVSYVSRGILFDNDQRYPNWFKDLYPVSTIPEDVKILIKSLGLPVLSTTEQKPICTICGRK